MADIETTLSAITTVKTDVFIFASFGLRFYETLFAQNQYAAIYEKFKGCAKNVI
ncbi:MAG: hypothetical protein ACRBBQ_13505 [Cognatishimia sp.]